MVSQFPSPAQDYMQTQIDLNAALIDGPAATFIVRVTGEAMEGAGIFDGDEIIVDTSIAAKPGQIIVARLDGEFTIKRFLIDRAGEGWLKPESPGTRPIRIHPEGDFHIFGVVTRCLRRLGGAS